MCSLAPLPKPPRPAAAAEPAPVPAVVAPKLKRLGDAAELPNVKDGAVPPLAVGGAGPPNENPWLPAAELLAPAPVVGWLAEAMLPAPKECNWLPAAVLVPAPTLGWLPAAELPAPKEKPWLPLALPKPNVGAPTDA